MSQEKEFLRIERERLPLFYRLILKMPIPTISTSVNIPSGIFWAIILPIFLFLDFFLNIYFLLRFIFPINIFLVCVVPVAGLVVFVRVTIDRFINWWNSSVVGSYAQRDIKKIVEEYVTLLETRGKKDTRTNE